MRILVCGSRNWTDYDRLASGIWKHVEHLESLDDLTVIHGGASGADSMAGDWADSFGIHWQAYMADWLNCAPECNPNHRKVNRSGREYCPTAGHRRNQLMLDDGNPDLVLAFTDDLSKSNGTRDMVTRAKKAGLLVYVMGHA